LHLASATIPAAVGANDGMKMAGVGEWRSDDGVVPLGMVFVDIAIELGHDASGSGGRTKQLGRFCPLYISSKQRVSN
jgi:hypothetical protein